MNIHKLHIFGKNRDAIAAQKGYTFQQLKTLEDWIENRVSNGQEDIYCDFEDDILTRDLQKSKTRFTQIKLYSTDFSFSSESIKKAISHFFSLYVKGEYAFDEVEFIFETNTGIVGKDVKGNDADLLREWSEQQESISKELLERIRTRIKSILNEYIDTRYQELKTKLEVKEELQKAHLIFKNLMDEDFDSFIKCIKWQFEGINTNVAVEQTLARINNLIPKIPLPLDSDKREIYGALLVQEVFRRSAMDNSEDRKLTSELLDSVLLNAGERTDKLYAEVFAIYKSAPKIEEFFPGEFQTVINGGRYCRWQQLDSGHRQIWLERLEQYIDLEETPIVQKRKAIYEYLFLKIGHKIEEDEESPILNDQELIQYYFEHWQERDRLQDIENDITIIQLIKGQVRIYDFPALTDDFDSWESQISDYLEHELTIETNIDRTCELLELQGHLAYQTWKSDKFTACKSAFGFYRQIPPLLEKAHYYSLANLYGQLKELIKVLTKIGQNDELVDMLDEFSLEIQPYAERTGMAHETAKELINRAALHIEKQDLNNNLKALDLCHRAKEFWRSKYTIEAYILCLFQISDIYSALGMTFAAKYYAMTASLVVWQSADSRLYKHMQQAFTRVQNQDFKQGAWINAVHDFVLYLISKREFEERGFEDLKIEEYNRSVAEVGMIGHCASILLPGYEELTEEFKAKLGYVWDIEVSAIVNIMEKQIPDTSKLVQVLEAKLVDVPFNDLGPNRNIQFDAMGNNWCISFKNTSKLNFIGEEFASFLQFTLTELTHKHADLFQEGKTISISIEEGHFQKEAIGEHNWMFTISEFDSTDHSETQKHYLNIGALVRTVLQPLSNKSKADFAVFFVKELLEIAKLGVKSLEGMSYQRLMRHYVGEVSDELTQNVKWENKVNLPIQRPKLLKRGITK